MAFTTGDRVVEVHVRGSVDDQRVENTLYFQHATEVNLPNLAILASDLIGYVRTAWLAQLPPAYQLRELYLVDLTTATSESYTLPAEPEDIGALSGIALPNNVSFTITFITALRGRSFRGRNYWPAVTESDVTGNRLSEARAGQIRNIYTFMVGASEISSDWTWGVFSRYQNKIQRTVGVFTACQSARYADLTVDSQRRRLPGRGR